ncbi:MAG: type II toxin-antitoxin system RelE/ParE family toxin [Candidatus Wallbacteria bacterium]|nr:type II toxin-antitoxin system RelE/ParE family toxin [Candidatus Wallbacteria bacterium]
MADLREIHGFIARDSGNYATAVVDRVLSAVSRLTEFPESGRAVPEFRGSAYREMIAGSYRAIYRFDERSGRVLVLAVVHGRRQLERALGPGRRPRQKT